MIAAMMPDKNELVERLYRLHFKKLFIYANAVLRDPEQAKDVVQDTFHEALRRIDVFAKLRKTFIHCTFYSCFYYFFREE